MHVRYVRMHVCMSVSMYVSVLCVLCVFCVYVCMYVFVCLHACMHLCMCVCMLARMYVCMYVGGWGVIQPGNCFGSFVRLSRSLYPCQEKCRGGAPAPRTPPQYYRA